MAVAEPEQTQNRASRRSCWLSVQVRSTRAMESAVPEKVGARMRMAWARSGTLELRWKSSVQAMFRLVMRASCWIPQVGVSPTRRSSKSS